MFDKPKNGMEIDKMENLLERYDLENMIEVASDRLKDFDEWCDESEYEKDYRKGLLDICELLESLRIANNS